MRVCVPNGVVRVTMGSEDIGGAMRKIAIVLLVVGVGTAGCTTTSSVDTTTTTATAASTTTTTQATTTTVPATTTTVPVTSTTTTVPQTTATTVATTSTAADPAPPQVTGVTAGLGGGSGEVYVQWGASPAPDLDHYAIYYSETAGGSKVFLADASGASTAYIDYPRDLTDGINCYQVAAVDAGGNEGPRSVEACFSSG